MNNFQEFKVSSRPLTGRAKKAAGESIALINGLLQAEAQHNGYVTVRDINDKRYKSRRKLYCKIQILLGLNANSLKKFFSLMPSFANGKSKINDLAHYDNHMILSHNLSLCRYISNYKKKIIQYRRRRRLFYLDEEKDLSICLHKIQ